MADLLADAETEAQDAEGRDAFVVDVDGYEGPLHLLLALARRQKVDLARVSILQLAEQYLAFVSDARDRRMDLAADYLLMAAWLAFLKSKLLLPGAGKAEEEEPSEGAAGRLAFRLARLDAMRQAGDALMAGLVDGRDVFARGAPERAVVARTTHWEASLYDVMSAFADIQLRRIKLKAHTVERQPVLTLDTARRRLVAMAAEMEEWRSVQSLRPEPGDAPDAPGRSVVASFFSAALELTRDRALELRQDAPLRDVLVRRPRSVGEMKAAE
ncbi:segregation/condensation protein A [bacterium]|nr:segregation/condensation protein A [bacterium]